MRKLLYGIAILIAVLTFSCDTSTTPFDDSLPDSYTLTTTVNPDEAGTVTPSGGEYVDGTRIVLRANPSEGYLFEEWQGDLTGSQNPAELFIRRNLNITALFSELQYQLNITIIGEGEVIQEVIAAEITGSQELQEPESDSSAEPPRNIQERDQDLRQIEREGGNELRSQSGDLSTAQDRVNPARPGTVQPTSTGNIVTQDFRGITVNQAVASYRLTAEPAEGWTFDRWEGDLTGNENPVDIVVDEDKDITAVFVEEQIEEFELTVTASGQGSFTLDPALATYPDGTDVTLTATPETGWRFGQWSGDLNTTDNPATLTMDSDKTVTAEFEQEGSAEVTITTQPGETTAGVAILPAPAVTLLDGFGDPVSGVTVTASLNQNGFKAGSTTQATTDDNGTATFDNFVIETAAAGYQITFDPEGDEFPSRTSTGFTVIEAGAEAGNSTAVVPDGVAGELTQIEISVRDAFGNPVGGVASDISLEVVSGDNEGASFNDVSDDGNGIYSASYTPTAAGADQISITLGGSAISGSPFSSTVITSSVSSANSSVTVDPSELQAGNSSTVTITLRDSENNPVSGSESNIQISGLSDATLGTITESGSTGIYNVDVTNTTAENITLTVVAESVTLSQNPEITFLPGVADNLAILSGNNQSGTVTQQLDDPLTVQITDEFGNVVPGETVTFEITQTPPAAAGQSLSATSVSTDANGTASTELTLGSTPGTYRVTASSGTVGSVVFSADAELGTVSELRILQQPGQTTAGEWISPSPSVEVLDAGGNLLDGLEVTVSEQGGYPIDAGTITVSSNASGVAEFGDLVIQSAGSYRLVFSVSEPGVNDVLSSPFTVTAASGDAANSTAVVPDGVAGEPTLISITVEDAFGNPVSGASGNLTVTVTGANNASPAVSEGGQPGEYTASYTPTAAGTDNISIELAGVAIQGSPFTSDVIVSDISASNSSVTANPKQLVVGNNSDVTVQLRDGSNNLIGGLAGSDFNISVTGNANAGSVSETSAGVYEFSVSNNTAQDVTVTISAQGVTLQDSPVITFNAGSPTQITITNQPQETVAGEPVAGTPAILLRDSFNNPVPGIEVTLSEQSGQGFSGGDLTVTSNASGIAAFSNAVFSEAGRYNLVFTAAGGLVVTSNAFDVIPAAADPANTTATVPNGAAGDPTNISITVRDAFDNRITGAAAGLSVSVSGPNAGETVSAITESGNGVYTTSYTPQSIGADQVTIELNGTGISGSPYSSNVITSDAELVEVTVQPQQTTAGEIIGGPPTVLVTDDLANPVEGVEVTVTVQGGELDAGTATRSTGSDGTAAFNDLVINTSGSYTLEFNAIGATDNAVSDPFDVVSAAAVQSAILSGNNQIGTVSTQLPDALLIRVSDSFGNPVSGHDVTFAIDQVPVGASGQSLSVANAVTDAAGEASTLLTLGNRTGTYTVNANAGAAGTNGFTATAQPAAADNFVFGTVSSPQTAGQDFSITITAEDEFGNRATGYAGTAALSTTAGTITPNSATFGSGQATLNVSVSDAGTGQSISATDNAITGTSNTFDVQTGGVDADLSGVTADPLTQTAGVSSEVTVVLRDGSGNAVSGLNDADFGIALSSANAVAGTIAETGTPGTYAFTVTNTVAETFTVTVTASGVTLSDVPSITFEPDIASQLNQDSGNGQTGTVTQSLADPFTVQLLDQFNNPVPGVSVNFAITTVPTDANGQALSVASPLTDQNGTASTILTLGDRPGTYTVEATSGALGPVTFTATAEIGEATLMSVTQQPTQTTAGAAITPAPAVEVTDDAGNPVEGINVTVSLNGASFTTGSTASALTDASGIAAFANLVTEAAGTGYTLTFNADAPGVSDVQSNSFDVVAASADPANTTADVPAGTAGNPTTITITVKDEFNNPVSGEAGNLSVTVSGDNSATPAVSETGTPGVYNASYTPTIAGSDEIAVTLGGVAISNSPQTSIVTTSDVSAVNSTVAANPATLQAGNSSTVTVELRDGSNNPIGGETDFVVTASGNATESPLTETATAGTYSFTVSNNTAETVNVTVTAGGVLLQDQPDITFTAADPDLMLITTEPGASIAGDPIAGPPAVRITDEFSNPVPGAGVTVTEQGGTTFLAGSTLSVNTDANGLAIFDNIAIGPVGSYNLVFSSAGVTNRTSNAFTISAGNPDASQSAASVPGGTAGAATGITITVEDTFGNRVEGVSADLAASVATGPNSGAIFAAISDDGNGIYTTSYTPTGAGTDQIAITLSGTGIQGSPFSSTVSAAAADPASTTANVPAGTAGESTTITVNVEDAFGNSVVGVAADLVATVSAGPNTGASVSTFSDFGGGSYTAAYTPVNAGDDEITITLGGVGISNSPETSTVSAGAADAAQSSIGANPASGLTADGTDASILTITARDASGNLLESVDVFFAITSGTGGALSAGPWTTDVNGEATATLTSVDANTITVTGYLGTDATGEVVGTADVDFEAGVPASVSASPIQGSAAADGSDTLEFVVMVEDANANPISDVSIIASDDGTDISYPAGSELNTDAVGEVTFTAVSSTVQTDVTFTFTEQSTSNNTTATGSFTDASGFTVADPGGQTAGTGFNLDISNASGIDGELLDGSINVTVNSDIEGEIHNQAVTFTAGAASVPVTLTTANDHILTVDVDGVTSNETVSVSVTAASASAQSILQQPAETTAGTALNPAPSVRVQDPFNNPVSGVNVTAILSSNDFTGTSTLAVATDANGIAEFTNLVIETAASEYSITFDADVAGVADADSDLFNVIAASASNLEFDTITSPQNAGSTILITLTAVDDFGNTDSTFSATADLATTAGTINPVTAAFTSGTATLNVSVTQSGTGHTITADEETSGITGTSNTFDVEPGDVDATGSSVTATSPHTADGTDASTVTIVLQDENGNAITGLENADFTVDLSSVTATAGTVSESVTPGTYTVSVTNSELESVTVTITVDIVTLDDTPGITYQ